MFVRRYYSVGLDPASALPAANKFRCTAIRVLTALIRLTFMGSLAVGQTTSVFDGSTPTGLATGSTPGSYAVSSFEHYNPFSGTLNPAIPLYHVGGRGDAGFELTWVIPQQWQTHTITNPVTPVTYSQTFTPPVQSWMPWTQLLGAGSVWGREWVRYEVCQPG